MFEKKMAEFRAIFWSNLDEAYSISYLRIASRNHGCGADLVFIQPENQTDLRSYLHREHHLNVAAGEADLVSCCAQRRHILSRMHFNRNRGFYAGESPSFLRSAHFQLSSPGPFRFTILLAHTLLLRRDAVRSQLIDVL